jgi:SAM-dependent methyltransferase
VSLLDRVHERFVSGRRVETLGRLLAEHVPRGASVLEVGAGSGELLAWIARGRPDLAVRGLDVLVRAGAAVPIDAFDGATLPFPDASFDLVLLVDVLHHTEDPRRSLAEARRVTRRHVLIKDHLLEGFLAGPTLRFMDRVGNERFGVALPYNYWTRERWLRAFDELGLALETFRPGLKLYPGPAGLAFNRSLHFIARLERSPRGSIKVRSCDPR